MHISSPASAAFLPQAHFLPRAPFGSHRSLVCRNRHRRVCFASPSCRPLCACLSPSSPFSPYHHPFLPTIPTHEEQLTIPASDAFSLAAYFVGPVDKHAVHGRGLILMTDILGFQNHHTRAVARTFAEAGLPTIVPDLFRGKPWTQNRPKSEYEEWRSQHDSLRVRDDVCAAYRFMEQSGYGSRLGMLGFCFGGGRLMEEIALAAQGLNPKVAVAFYPTRFDPESVGRNATCSLLFITGDQDELVPMSVVESLKDAAGEENSKLQDCEIQIVEGAGHAFAHHPKTEQNEIDGEIVVSRAVEYLVSNL